MRSIYEIVEDLNSSLCALADIGCMTDEEIEEWRNIKYITKIAKSGTAFKSRIKKINSFYFFYFYWKRIWCF